MDTYARSFSFHDVVLVADMTDQSASADLIHQRRDLEMTDAETLGSLQSAISALGLKMHHYRGPDALARCASRHKDDIVLTIYGGQRSRNRMALVPAVCEAFGLRFVGPDVYGRIIAQDKEISKRLASDCGLRTPAWRVVRDARYLSYASGISLPVVVKPLFEGSSIGITQRNLISKFEDVATFGQNLLSEYGQPILIEEFVAGREVAYSRIQNVADEAWAFSEIIIEGDRTFFERRLFDAQEKQFRTSGRTVRNIDDEISDNDRNSIESFLNAFGTYGYCRVDGRMADGKFSFIELSPDAWIGPRGQFAMSFLEKGWTYPAVIAAVLASAD